MSLQKGYRLRDGTYTTIGEFTLWGLIQIRMYPNKDEWGFQREVWRQKQHDYGNPGHRLSLMRHDKRVKRNYKGTLPVPPSWYWD